MLLISLLSAPCRRSELTGRVSFLGQFNRPAALTRFVELRRLGKSLDMIPSDVPTLEPLLRRRPQRSLYVGSQAIVCRYPVPNELAELRV